MRARARVPRSSPLGELLDVSQVLRDVAGLESSLIIHATVTAACVAYREDKLNGRELVHVWDTLLNVQRVLEMTPGEALTSAAFFVHNEVRTIVAGRLERPIY